MDTVIEVGVGKVTARRSAAFKVLDLARRHRTLCIGALYAVMIAMVLAVATTLY